MPQFDALKSPLLAYAVYNARFVPPSRWVTFSAPSSTLTNFPALVKARNYTNIANGYDVHFQDANGNELTFDLDWYDNSTKSGAWWVRIPTLSSSGPTSIKMCYGDAALTTNRSDPSTVWADYEFVYHFNAASKTQSAAKGNSSTYTQTPRSIVLTAEGPTGRAVEVTNGAMDGGPFFGWTRTPTISASYRDFSITTIGTVDAGIVCYNESGIYKDRYIGCNKPGSGVTYTSLPLTSGLWCGVSCSYTHSLSSPQMYVVANGSSQSLYNLSYLGSKWYFAGTTNGRTYQVDEVRIRNSAVSLAWQQYEYNQTLNHDTYTTYGPEE